MSSVQYSDLSKEELARKLAAVEALAVETDTQWRGLIGTHDTHCHTRHAGCLAAAVLDTLGVKR